MKKNFLFGILAILLAGFGFGGISLATTSILVSPTNVDFGTVVKGFTDAQSDAVLRPVIITNNGDTTITVNTSSNHRTDGPFGTYWFDTTKQIAPGGTGEIRLRLAQSSAFANTAGNYNTTYVFKATNVSDSGDTATVSVTASAQIVEPVAQVGTTNYPTLAAAIDAADEGDVVTLLSDVTLTANFPINKGIKLDLGGNTINTNGKWFYFNGNHTSEIYNGTLENITGGVPAFDVDGGANVTIKGGTYSGINYAIIVEGGSTLTIENAVVTATHNQGITVRGHSTLIIQDGVFTSQETTVAVFEGSNVTIDGGTYTARDNFLVAANGTAGSGENTITINDGTFNANIESSGYIGCGVYAPNNDTVNINGGVFNVPNGVGVLVRGGTVTVSSGVVLNVDGSSLGKVGDANVQVPAGKEVVMDIVAKYPGNNPLIVTNNITGTYVIAGTDKANPDRYTISIKDGETVIPLTLTRVDSSATITDPNLSKDGYELLGRFNGEEATESFDFSTVINSDLALSTRRAQAITAINITGVTLPVAGATPTTDGITTDAEGVTLKSAKRMKGTYGSLTELTEGETFTSNTVYTLFITFAIDEGYKLSNTRMSSNATPNGYNSSYGILLGSNGDDYEYGYGYDVAAGYTVKWNVEGTDVETDTNVAYNSAPEYNGATPTKAATSTYTYTFSGWSKDGTSIVDLSAETITENTTYTAIFTQKKKSGGGGGGGGSNSTTTNNTGSNTNTGNTTQVTTGDAANTTTGDTVTDETNSNEENNSELNGGNNEGGIDSDNGGDNDSQSKGVTYSQEFRDAYNFAFNNGITTMPNIEKADMEGGLTRIAMAKMLSQYAINILKKTPDTSRTISFPDVSEELDAQYDNGVTLAYQLGIMGIGIEEFRPFDNVTRAEFVTALSRLLFGTADGEGLYYETHMKTLFDKGIITVTDPNLQELRGYVMIMLMRSAED